MNVELFEKMLEAMVGTDEPVVVEELHPPVCECAECKDWYWTMFGSDMPALSVNWKDGE